VILSLLSITLELLTVDVTPHQTRIFDEKYRNNIIRLDGSILRTIKVPDREVLKRVRLLTERFRLAAKVQAVSADPDIFGEIEVLLRELVIFVRDLP
jgi:hypothetical protein